MKQGRHRRAAFVAVGRPTFDLESAGPLCEAARKVVRREIASTVGNARIHLTPTEVETCVATWPADINTVVIAFGTFTDATLVAAAVDELDDDLLVVLWAFPEPRTGGRLLRNSMCGANLAAYHCGSLGRRAVGMYVSPLEAAAGEALSSALDAGAEAVSAPVTSEEPGFTAAELKQAIRVAHELEFAHIGIIGDPPPGFDPSTTGSDPLSIGATFQLEPLEDLFNESKEVETPVRLPSAAFGLQGVSQLDATATTRSLQLHRGLRRLVDRHDWDAVALRCWPECFTQWGGAPCAPLSFLTDEGVPAACEADGYGALTSLMLTKVSERPTFLADLVDIDSADNTAVFWHCGVAPSSMADPTHPRRAAVHPNRQIPLTVSFGLRPGRVTIARLSQSRNLTRLVVGSGVISDAPPPFAGTSAVVKMDADVGAVFTNLIAEGLEHHWGVVYGNHVRVLKAIAHHWGIDVVELGSYSDVLR